MVEMYKSYKDIAEFRIVYINEAHAADSNWPVDYAKEMGIVNHTDYGDRCDVAKRFLDDKEMPIPCVIDKMDNKVNEAYQGWPTRIYLVREDGKLGVVGGRGPWGLAPGIKEANAWLAAYKETGKEPELPPPGQAEGEEGESPAQSIRGPYRAIVGDWKMGTEFQGRTIEATMVISLKDEKLSGTWTSQGRDMPMQDVAFEDGKLTFSRSMGGENVLKFEGTVENNRVTGAYTGPFGELTCTGERTNPPRRRPQRQRPSMEDTFKEWDADGDGKLSEEEMPERMAMAFDRLDADDDGFVTLEEMGVFRRGGRGGDDDR